MKILIVDDNVDCLRANRATINKTILFQEIEEAYSGEEALAKVSQAYKTNKPFDLVFLDIVMPGIGGIRTLQELKKEYPDLKVVIISGDTKSEDVMKAFRSSCDGYIVKPVQTGKLERFLDKESPNGSIQNKQS